MLYLTTHRIICIDAHHIAWHVEHNEDTGHDEQHLCDLHLRRHQRPPATAFGSYGNGQFQTYLLIECV